MFYFPFPLSKQAELGFLVDMEPSLGVFLVMDTRLVRYLVCSNKALINFNWDTVNYQLHK